MAGEGKNIRPLIGITGPNRGGTIPWLFSRFSIMLAGGRALRITPANPPDFSKLDGLVVGGGADVEPVLYGEELVNLLPELNLKKSTLKHKIVAVLTLIFYPFLLLLRKIFSIKTHIPVGKDRDKLEMELIGYAIKNGLPVLGICRGAQLLNVFFGGSLFQKVKEFYTETPQPHTILPQMTIFLEEKSRLAEILKTSSCKVNALHNQAIKQLGKGLEVVARESNKIVQAIEHRRFPFVIGVQWHPEYLMQIPRQRRLFKALIKAARIFNGRCRTNRKKIRK